MKKSGFHLARTAFAVAAPVLAPLLAPTAGAQLPTPFIFENYDNNPTGNVFPNISTISTTATRTGGYGVTGMYTSLGSAYTGAFEIVEGGLQFGSLAPTTAGKKLRATGNNTNATGISIMIDGGRAPGDIEWGVNDVVWTSYLFRFTSLSSLAGARAEVRINGNSTTAYELHMDGPTATGVTNTTTTMAQPRAGYQLNNWRYSPTPASQGFAKDTTYLMVARFNQAGNYMGSSGNFTFAINSNALVVSGTAFPTGLEVGHLIKGADVSSGIPENSIVTGLQTVTVDGVTTRTVLINKTTTAASPMSNDTVPVPVVVSLSTAPIAQDGALTTLGRTTAGSNTLTNLPSGHKVVAGQVIIHANLPAGTTVTSASATTALLSNNATATATSDITLTLRPIAPITAAQFTAGATSITVDRIPTLFTGGSTNVAQISVGNLVEGPGIAEGTVVSEINETTRQITLSKPTVLTTTSTSVMRFFKRFGAYTMWGLTEAQYTDFMSKGGIGSDLDAITIGPGAAQATVKISGTQSVGNWDLNQGKRLDVVVQGTSASNQTFFLDEVRYGFDVRAVTLNTPYGTPPPSNPNSAGDNMDGNFVEMSDGGWGWKSGYYALEETQATWLSSRSITPLRTGSGKYLELNHRAHLSGDLGTRRRPDPRFVDMSQPYTVSFDYRVSFGSGEFRDFSNRIQIGADGPTGAGTNLGPNPAESNGLTWMVGIVGGNDGTTRTFNTINPLITGTPPRRLYWYFWDHAGASVTINNAANFFVEGNMKSSGVQFIESGGIYHFVIEVNPLTNTYKATVTNVMTGETGSVANLRFRTTAKAHTLFWGLSKSAGGTDRVIDLDNVLVSQGIPYVDPFPSWISAFSGVPSGLTGRNADANGDGRRNFLDFALDGNPMSGVRNSKEIHAVTNVGGTNYYTITIPVRAGATFSTSTGPSISTQVDGITYRIQGSYDLTNWVPAAGVTVPDVVPLASPLTTTPALNTGWEYKSFRLSSPTSAQPKGFLRAVVDNAVSP